MKQDAVGSPAGGELLDDDAGLQIDHMDRVLIQTRGIQQSSVRRDRNVADEVAVSALLLADNSERPLWFEFAVGECIFEDGSA